MASSSVKGSSSMISTIPDPSHNVKVSESRSFKQVS